MLPSDILIGVFYLLYLIPGARQRGDERNFRDEASAQPDRGEAAKATGKAVQQCKPL